MEGASAWGEEPRLREVAARPDGGAAGPSSGAGTGSANAVKEGSAARGAWAAASADLPRRPRRSSVPSPLA